MPRSTRKDERRRKSRSRRDKARKAKMARFIQEVEATNDHKAQQGNTVRGLAREIRDEHLESSRPVSSPIPTPGNFARAIKPFLVLGPIMSSKINIGDAVYFEDFDGPPKYFAEDSLKDLAG